MSGPLSNSHLRIVKHLRRAASDSDASSAATSTRARATTTTPRARTTSSAIVRSTTTTRARASTTAAASASSAATAATTVSTRAAASVSATTSTSSTRSHTSRTHTSSALAATVSSTTAATTATTATTTSAASVSSAASTTVSSSAAIGSASAANLSTGSSLTGGGIAGIVIGVIAGVAILAAFIFFSIRRKRNTSNTAATNYQRHTSTDDLFGGSAQNHTSFGGTGYGAFEKEKEYYTNPSVTALPYEKDATSLPMGGDHSTNTYPPYAPAGTQSQTGLLYAGQNGNPSQNDVFYEAQESLPSNGGAGGGSGGGNNAGNLAGVGAGMAGAAVAGGAAAAYATREPPTSAPATTGATPGATTAGPADTTSPFIDSPDQGNIFTVLRTFQPGQDDELVISPGDHVQILVRYDDGWALGTKIGPGGAPAEKGVFPYDCVNPDIVEDGEEDTAALPNAQPASAPPIIHISSHSEDTHSFNHALPATPAEAVEPTATNSSSTSVNSSAQTKRTSSLIASRDANLFVALGEALERDQQN